VYYLCAQQHVVLTGLTITGCRRLLRYQQVLTTGITSAQIQRIERLRHE